MQKPFGATLTLTLSRSRPWLSLGPGWAAVAGILSAGYPEPTWTTGIMVVSLWLLVDPLLGTLWELLVRQQLWAQISQADLPPAPRYGFMLPYAQPGSAAGRLVVRVRRYHRWWRDSFWPAAGDQVLTAGLGLALALLIGLALHTTIFWLVILTLVLTVLAAFLTARRAGELQSGIRLLVHFFLPWGMGLLLFPDPALWSLLLAFCYGVVYLGGARLLAGQTGAVSLLLLGQVTVLILLLAVRLWVGAVIVGVLFAAQLLLRTSFTEPAKWLGKIQPYLVAGLLVAAVAVGSLGIG